MRGRLAVIDRPETHQFILQKFILQNFEVNKVIWIGLRYWCHFRLLEWNGLRPYSPSDPGHFQAWHPQWARGKGCVGKSARGWDAVLGVYYQPLGKQSARWQAVGFAKFFNRFLVEYPTGEE